MSGNMAAWTWQLGVLDAEVDEALDAEVEDVLDVQARAPMTERLQEALKVMTPSSSLALPRL